MLSLGQIYTKPTKVTKIPDENGITMILHSLTHIHYDLATGKAEEDFHK
jgi:hypothetical protein